MDSDGSGAPKFCGNILVRRSKQRSFINKTGFEGVFGVLTDHEFMYYRNSSQWTNKEKPQLVFKTSDIQAVEEVDDVAFSRQLCFQIIYTSRVKRDESRRTLYLAAYELDELRSWISSIRSVCLLNPVTLLYYHPGKFTGRAWTCCSSLKHKTSPGCKPSTIPGLPEIRKQKFKVSSAIEFFGFTVIANESFDSNLPGSLPFKKGDHLTVTEAAGKHEWKAFSASSTSEFGVIPRERVTMADITQEPWYFSDIPGGLATAILREQDPGCFLLRLRLVGYATILSIRNESTVKHVEIAFDESSQKYRIKDESDSVSYANFLQFETIQQLLDQCKQHPTLGLTLDTYPPIQTVEELWKLDWSDVNPGEEIASDLPWVLMEGKFRNQSVLIHLEKDGCSETVKEGFTNQARILMTLCHENVVRFCGMGTKGCRGFLVHTYYPKGILSDYLSRNAPLLVLHPSELVNIATQILSGMAYLEKNGVVHGELVADNCLIGDKGSVKISGFHCASSSWCAKPLNRDCHINKVPLPAPELDNTKQTSKSDVWAFGLLVYTIITAGQRPIASVDEVLKFQDIEDILDYLDGFADIMTLCLRTDPTSRPTFDQLQQRCNTNNRLHSTPSASSYSLELEGTFCASNGAAVLNTIQETLVSNETFLKDMHNHTLNSGDLLEDLPSTMKQSIPSFELSKVSGKNGLSYSSDDVMERLKMAELEALKAKVLHARAEADKEEVLRQVQEAERKCLKEVELITRTFICRLNEANDRTSEADHARYVAEEAKRLAEEKFTLFKYESERTIHEIKTLLEETMLERDELAVSLKAVGMDEESQCSTLKRTDSLKELENKYQRYISTSDRTVQNMKSQLDEVVRQRDSLVEERDAARVEARDIRDLLENVRKEKEDLVFRLDESNCEVERLEETISRMAHKRQKAERERDQLQILTDMSLMKLRHAEKPKKRHSLCTLPSKQERNPNFQELSMELMGLMTPKSKRRQSDGTIYETSEVHSADEAFLSSRNESEDERFSSPPLGSSGKHMQRGASDEYRIGQAHLRRGSTPRESDSETELISSLSRVNRSYIKSVLNCENQNEKLNKRMFNGFGKDTDVSHSESEENDTSVQHVNNDDDLQNFTVKSLHFEMIQEQDDIMIPDKNRDKIQHERLDQQDSLSFRIPTVHVEEVGDSVEPNAGHEEKQSIPEIEISLVDDNENFTSQGYFSEDEETSERVFVVPLENGDTSMVFSFDSDGSALKGVPHTVL